MSPKVTQKYPLILQGHACIASTREFVGRLGLEPRTYRLKVCSSTY